MNSNPFEVSIIRPKIKICTHANLPAFKDAGELRHWLHVICSGDHPSPTLAKWDCKMCGCMHVWTAGGQTDSNGKFRAGADKIPARIQTLINESATTETNTSNGHDTIHNR